MIPLFIGFDQREAATYHVLVQSVLDSSTVPVAITPLHKPMLRGFDGQQDGTNAFIYSRFLVPELMQFKGWALYVDSDMLFRDDIIKLWDRIDESKAVMVVKHEYETMHHEKFVGTPINCRNEHYPRKNWSSLILWNCGHPRNKILTRQFVSEAGGRVLHRFSWLDDDLIGEIPSQWNHLVTEYGRDAGAKNVHFTLGAPGFSHYQLCDYSDEWNNSLLRVNEMIGEKPALMVARAK